MRTPIMVGNWKMHGSVKESCDRASGVRSASEGVKDVEVGVCPPFPALQAVQQVLKGGPVALGAQNVHWEKKGAFTGEVAPDMLLELGCRYAIIGHSERRHVMGETDEMANKKVLAALAAGLTPILCVGELIEEREKGITNQVVERQVREGLKGVPADGKPGFVIAYEPVWAIGTGKTATPEIAQEVHGLIRGLLAKQFGAAAEEIRIQYGGSVKPKNVRELMEQKDIDGALVGGASLEVESFSKIIRFREQ